VNVVVVQKEGKGVKEFEKVVDPLELGPLAMSCSSSDVSDSANMKMRKQDSVDDSIMAC
jgi:hypothetical protein